MKDCHLLGCSKRNVSRLHRLTRCIWSDRSHVLCLVCDQQKWRKKASAQESDSLHQFEGRGSPSEKTEIPNLTKFHQFPTTFGFTNKSGHTHTHTHATTVVGWLPVRYERLVLGACPDPGTSKSVTIRDFYADDFGNFLSGFDAILSRAGPRITSAIGKCLDPISSFLASDRLWNFSCTVDKLRDSRGRDAPCQPRDIQLKPEHCTCTEVCF